MTQPVHHLSPCFCRKSLSQTERIWSCISPTENTGPLGSLQGNMWCHRCVWPFVIRLIEPDEMCCISGLVDCSFKFYHCERLWSGAIYWLLSMHNGIYTSTGCFTEYKRLSAEVLLASASAVDQDRALDPCSTVLFFNNCTRAFALLNKLTTD